MEGRNEMRPSMTLWLQHNLDTIILLMLEDIVAMRRVISPNCTFVQGKTGRLSDAMKYT